MKATATVGKVAGSAMQQTGKAIKETGETVANTAGAVKSANAAAGQIKGLQQPDEDANK